MADNREDILAKAKEIQRQKLLEKAQAIQQEKLMTAQEPQGPRGILGGAYDVVESVGSAVAPRIAGALAKTGLPTLLGAAGGITRAAIANPIQNMVEGKTNSDYLQKVKEAIKGNYQPSSEYLKESGVPEGKLLSQKIPFLYNKTGQGLRLQAGGPLDPSERAIAGFERDVVTDPLTYGSWGLVPAAKLVGRGMQALKETPWLGTLANASGKVIESGVPAILNPATEAIQPAGKYMYKMGFKPIDAVSEKFNKIPASEIAFKYGLSGTNKQIATQADSLINKLRGEKQAILDTVEAAQTPVDYSKALSGVQDKINEWKTSNVPQKEAAANILQSELEENYLPRLGREPRTIISKTPSSVLDASGKPIMKDVSTTIPGVKSPTVNEVEQMKQALYGELGSESYKNASKASKDLVKQGQKQLGRGLKESLQGSAELTQPGLGQALAEKNAEMGGLLTTAAAMDKEALKGANKNLITSVDPMVFELGYGSRGHSGGGRTALIMKKLADLSKTTAGRTTLGKATYNLGGVPGMNAFLRRSPWETFKDKQYSEENK